MNHKYTDELWMARKKKTDTADGFPGVVSMPCSEDAPCRSDDYVVETASGREIAVVKFNSDEETTESNARLIGSAPLLLKALEETVAYYCGVCRGVVSHDNDKATGNFGELLPCPYYKMLEMRCTCTEKCIGQKWLEILAIASNKKSDMTTEQEVACREYIDAIAMIQDYIDGSKTEGSYYDKVPEKLEETRKKAHLRLVELYGFLSESDTWDVTGNIHAGMKPSDLHRNLLALKKNRTM